MLLRDICCFGLNKSVLAFIKMLLRDICRFGLLIKAFLASHQNVIT